MSFGTVMSTLTLPLASARNGKSLTALSSWTVPISLAGRCVAFTNTFSPALTVDADSQRVGDGGLVAYQMAPMTSSTRTVAATTTAIGRRRSLCAAGPAGAGGGITTVELGLSASSSAGSASAAAATGLASATVGAWAAALTLVFTAAGAGFSFSATAKASTNAAQLSHRKLGSLARPRRMTSSTCGLSKGLWALGGAGSRCTCA